MIDHDLTGENETAARFEAVALPCLDALFGRALSLIRRPEDANDLVQETYLRAFRNFSSFQPGTNGKAWLFTIMYSIFVNQYRKAKRKPMIVSLDEQEEVFHHALADDNWEASYAAFEKSQVNWHGPEVNSALEKLPESFRAAILLVDVDELNYEEAAAVLDCPVGTLRSRLFRARKLLFVELRDYAQKTGFIRNNPV